MRMFPSPTLTRYIAQMFAVRVLAFIFGLVMVLQTLDLLSESDKILAPAGSGYPEILRYLGWRLPQLLSQFLPFSVLLATLVTLATLNQNSEVVIMRAAAISAHQVLAPLLLTGLAISVAHFFFNEAVVAPSTARLSAWERAEYARVLPPADSGTRDIWVTDGASIVRADRAVLDQGRLILPGLQIFERGSDPNLRRIIKTDRAELAGKSWTLYGVRTYDVDGRLSDTVASMPWRTELESERFLAAAVDPNGVSYPRLARAIRELKAGGHPTESLQAALQHKVSGPLSSLLMPILGAIAAFGVVRSGKLFVRIVIGMALGFAYFVADNFMMAMGQFGTVPPLMAAWSAPLLFFCVGESVLFRTEE